MQNVEKVALGNSKHFVQVYRQRSYHYRLDEHIIHEGIQQKKRGEGEGEGVMRVSFRGTRVF